MTNLTRHLPAVLLGAMSIVVAACGDDLTATADGTVARFSATVRSGDGNSALAAGTTVYLSSDGGASYLPYTTTDDGGLTPPATGPLLYWPSNGQALALMATTSPEASSTFTLPPDQSSAAGLAAADLLTYVGSLSSDGEALTLQHTLTRVTLTVSDELQELYPADEGYTFALTVYTVPSVSVSLSSTAGTTVTPEVGDVVAVTPLASTDGRSATAIIAPGGLDSSIGSVRLQPMLNGVASGATLTFSGMPTLSAGHSYVLTLSNESDAPTISVSALAQDDWEVVTSGNEASSGTMSLAWYLLEYNSDGDANWIQNELIYAVVQQGYAAVRLRAWGDTDGGASISSSGIFNPNEEVFQFNEVKDELMCLSLLESGITSIDENTFQGYLELQSIVFPEQLDYIGSGAFQGGVLEGELSLPSGMSYIGESAFSNNDRLTSIRLGYMEDSGGDGCEIQTNAFANCYQLQTITMYGVNTVCTGAFSGCDQVNSLVIDATTIESQSIPFGYNLYEIQLPNVTNLADDFFDKSCVDSNSLEDVYNNIAWRTWLQINPQLLMNGWSINDEGTVLTSPNGKTYRFQAINSY